MFLSKFWYFDCLQFALFYNGCSMSSVYWRGHKDALYWFYKSFSTVSWKLILELSERLRTYQNLRLAYFRFCVMLLLCFLLNNTLTFHIFDEQQQCVCLKNKMIWSVCKYKNTNVECLFKQFCFFLKYDVFAFINEYTSFW